MTQRRPSFLWLAIFFAVAAVGIHTYLTNHHLSLQYGTNLGDSICNINNQFDCDSVNTSTYSELLGVPLALWGAINNLAIALLLLWAIMTNLKNENLNRIVFLYSGAIALVSVVMLAISATQLGTFCLFCILSYVASFGLFISIFLALGVPSNMVSESVRYLFTGGEEGGRSYLIFFVVVLGSVFLVNGMSRTGYGGQLDEVARDSVQNWKLASPVQIDTSTGLHMKPTDGTYKMNIVEFADFNCPHCKTAAPVLHAFAKSRKDVQLTFMNFPLDGNCNAAIESPGKTCVYAKVTYCAKSQNKGWETHDWFFKHQGSFEGLDLVVKDVGIDFGPLKECVDSSATHETIMKQASEGKNAGVKGTPTIFVNGRPVMGGQFMPVLNEVYKNL
jgi:protein-disulfide isomerase/uncharacterized membrane protein